MSPKSAAGAGQGAAALNALVEAPPAALPEKEAALDQRLRVEHEDNANDRLDRHAGFCQEFV